MKIKIKYQNLDQIGSQIGHAQSFFMCGRSHSCSIHTCVLHAKAVLVASPPVSLPPIPQHCPDTIPTVRGGRVPRPSDIQKSQRLPGSEAAAAAKAIPAAVATNAV